MLVGKYVDIEMCTYNFPVQLSLHKVRKHF